MKKILVNKNEGIAEIVEKIISETDTEITLIIPRETSLDDSVANFQLIKREASAAGKNVVIESVDENILSLAKASHLESIHPLFRRRKSSSLSDIVPKEGDVELAKATGRISSKKTRKKASSQVDQSRGAEEPEETHESVEEDFDYHPNTEAETTPFLFPEKELPSPRRIVNIKKLVLWGAIPVVIIAGIMFATGFFKKAEVTMSFASTPFVFAGEFRVETGLAGIDVESKTLPGEVFTQEKNITQLFPASGRKHVSLKAIGKIVIYNAYSSDPQTLVATTRFLTPDNKLYRLDETIIVPGAQVKDGEIIPASIEAAITADQAGPEFNSGPVARLSIPGFKGSPKYDGFYGSLVKASGGFIGEKAYPTDAEIKDARAKIGEILEDSLKNEFFASKPDGFEIIEGSSEFEVVRTSISTATNEEGKFSVFGQGSIKAIGFKTSDLRSALLSMAEEDSQGKVFKDIKIKYSDPSLDFEDEKLSFTIAVDAVITEDFNPQTFKNEILGKKIKEAQSIARNIKGLESAKVSIFPSWLKTLPSDPKRIKITVN